jgi:putative ABC transport system permease protein
LGIIIGVGTIVAMTAIGNGAKAQVEAQVASLGRNVLMVYPGSINSSRSGVRLGYGSSITLSAGDADAIGNSIDGVSSVSPEIYTFDQAVAGNQNWKVKVYGEAPDFFDIRQWPLAEGEAFSDVDVRGAAKIAVIGQTAAEQLYGPADPVGQTVRIKNVPFQVVGRLEAKGFDIKGHDQDNVIIVPYTSAIQRLMGKNANLYAINVQAADDADLATVQERIAGLLRERHRIEPGKEDDFIVRNQQEIAETATATAHTMTVLLAAIASISLVVGGIGIMNIMLVSVVERTREIGIRMAVGARSGDILQQFLVEAFTLSSLGGGVGILLGVGASKFLSALAGWPTRISLEAVLVAFLFSAAVGIFFGWYPARKASLLDPIDALRYE